VIIAWLRAVTAVSFATCDLTDHLHSAISGLGHRARRTGEHRAGGGLGVDRVARAAQMPDTAIGPVELHTPVAVPTQVRHQPGAVGPAALHAVLDLLAPLARPPLQLRLAGPVHRDRDLPDHRPTLVSRHRNRGALGSIDTDGDASAKRIRHPPH
jgi:hypothetical protein